MKLKQISWVPAILIMGIIFYFSSKPAVNSDEDSMVLANKILDAYENITEIEFQIEEKIDKLDIINHVVRKGAHFLEYAVLACAIAFHLWVRNWKGRKLFLLSVAATAIYAATDEFHQLFIPGRSGELKDVLIDSTGAAAGAFFFCIVIVLFSKKQRKKAIIMSSK